MIYKVDWTFLAKTSYTEEIDFIYFKWNLKEVEKFEQLTNIEINRLSKNPKIGKFENNLYSLVISKQTTLFYRIMEEISSIELIFFWNNQKNPEELNNLL